LRPAQLPTGVYDATGRAPSGNLGTGADTIITITFCFGRSEDADEVTVIINGSITMTSTMEEVMVEGEVNKEFRFITDHVDSDGLRSPVSDSTFDLASCYFGILRADKTFMTFTWNQFKGVTVETLVRLKNVHENYFIQIQPESSNSVVEQCVRG